MTPTERDAHTAHLRADASRQTTENLQKRGLISTTDPTHPWNNA